MGGFSPALALASRVVLAAVLSFAAGAKIAGHRDLPAQLRAMGITARSSGAIAIALPAVELGVAVSLVAAPHSAAPGVLAIVVLGGFTVFLFATARAAVPCPCFGAVRTARAAAPARAVARNVVLIAVAVLATGPVAGARGGGTAVVALGLGAIVAAAVGGLA